MSFLFDNGPLPFCHTEINEEQFAAWVPRNKEQWLGPCSLDQVLRLYWLSKKIKFTTPSSPNSFFVDLIHLVWDGDSWEPTDPENPEIITLDYPANENIDISAIHNVPGITDRTIYAIGPQDFTCSGKTFRAPGFLDSTSTPSVSDSRFVYTQLSVGFFSFLSVPDGTGLTGVNYLWRSSDNTYYVPFNCVINIAIDPEQFVLTSLFSDFPPPPPDFGYPNPAHGFDDYAHGWSSSNIQYSNEDFTVLHLNVLGITAVCRSQGFFFDLTEDPQDFQLTIEDDPDYFLDF